MMKADEDVRNHRRIVLATGLAAVLGLTLVGLGSAQARDEGKTIEIAVTEKGFEPSPIKLEKGKPVTLVVTRKTDKTCAKEIILEEYGIEKDLPLNQPVKLSFTPKKSGTLKYGCGMNKMVAGILKVE